MSQTDLALICHLLGVVTFFGGLLVALVVFEAARRSKRTGDIAVLLGLAPVAVLIVGIGLGVVVITGLWLIRAGDLSLDDGWIVLALGFLIVSAGLGAVGGRAPKQARLLAVRSPAEEAPSPELRALLDDRAALAFNIASAIAALGVLVLMVWRPSL